jgi:hypothetical protein
MKAREAKTNLAATSSLAVTTNFNKLKLERIIASTNNLGMNCMSTTPNTSMCTADARQNRNQTRGIDGREAADGSNDIWDTHSSLNSIIDVVASATTTTLVEYWICDSGASRHITNDSTLFSQLEPCKEAIGGCKQGSQLEIIGKGTIEIFVTNTAGKQVILELRDVQYAPNARCNLLSLHAKHVRTRFSHPHQRPRYDHAT